MKLTCSTAGKGRIVTGDANGNIHLLPRSLQISTFKAYEVCVTHIVQMRQANVLVTVGSDDEEFQFGCFVKVWSLDRMEADNPLCVRTLKPLADKNQTPQITAIAIHESMTLMVLGFSTGLLRLVRGDVAKESNSKHIDIDRIPDEEITTLAFKPTPTNSTNRFLFVTTKSTIIVYNVGGRQISKEVLDSVGCDLKCSALSDISQDCQYVVGRPEAIFFYNTESKGSCLVFEGQKSLIAWHKNYLITVCKDVRPTVVNPRLRRPESGSGPLKEIFQVSIYDIQNKLIAFNAPFPEVQDVVCEWGAVFIISGVNNTLYRLVEKDTQAKLELLFRRNSYQMAITIAKSQQYDADGLNDIFRQYGDYLYGKNDFDEAVQQYVKTIGRLEPSYVVRKFLDAHRIYNLTDYLEHLHIKRAASKQHTTLLLNCYIKLKDKDKLRKFISQIDEVEFDVDTAIRVCRQAGYLEHALSLASVSGKHDLYLKILLEDRCDCKKALEYISVLDFEDAETNLLEYGKILVDKVPEEATQLIIGLSLKQLSNTNDPFQIAPDAFIKLFVEQPDYLAIFLERMIEENPIEHSSSVYNTLLELYLQKMTHGRREGDYNHELEEKTMKILRNFSDKYDLDHALILCQMHNFRDGILHLYERANLFNQILRFHMENNEFEKVWEICSRHGDDDPGLWKEALVFFGKHEHDCEDKLKNCLSIIDSRNIIPPLLVVQTLAANTDVSLGTVKEYLLRKLAEETVEISQNELRVNQYKQDIAEMKDLLVRLKEEAHIFKTPKCNICMKTLEVPSVHFFCDHSYHQHCFSVYDEADEECPLCSAEFRKVQDELKSFENIGNLHEQFSEELNNSRDGFSVISKYFGHGVFNKAAYKNPAEFYSRENNL